MKNTSLFMMFTLLGVPGFVAAANTDLANAEYNFAVNELSRLSLNQAAIIGQQGVLNDAQVRQGGSKLLSIVSQDGSGIRAVSPMMLILRKTDLEIVRKLSRKGRVIEQASRSTVHRKPQL